MIDKPKSRDLRSLAKRIHTACSAFDYLSPASFRGIADAVVYAYDQGRGVNSDDAHSDTLKHLRSYALKARCEEGVWFSKWVQKVGLAAKTRSASTAKSRIGDIAGLFEKSGTYPLEDFGVLFASNRKPGLVLFTWSGYVLCLEDMVEGIDFATRLWEALKQAEGDLRIAEVPDLIPPDYAQEAVEAFEDKMRLDAWKNDQDDG